MFERIEITADDEMPVCGKCEHVCDDFDCGANCGPEHGWWGYRRYVRTTQDGMKGEGLSHDM